jgi:hypothetical protein
MHTLILLAVDAATSDEAEQQAEEWLAGHDLGDWWSIGGRWTGYLDGSNTLCAATDTERFTAVVTTMLQIRQARFNDLRQHLRGPDPAVEPYDPFGFGGMDPEALAQRQQQWYLETSRLFTEMLTRRELPDDEYWMLGYYLQRFGALIMDAPHLEAGIIDTVNESVATAALLERCALTPERQWLVVVDVHH